MSTLTGAFKGMQPIGRRGIEIRVSAQKLNPENQPSLIRSADKRPEVDIPSRHNDDRRKKDKRANKTKKESFPAQDSPGTHGLDIKNLQTSKNPCFSGGVR